MIALSSVALSKRSGKTGASWEDLAMHRERAVWSRHLPAFRAFINYRNQFSANLHYKFAFSADLPEQYMPFKGVLIDTTYVKSQGVHRLAGRFKGAFYWNEWTTEPTSAEFSLSLDKALVERNVLHDTEFGAMIKESIGRESHRSEFGAVQWHSRSRTDGGLDVTLRLTYPSPWMPSVPRTDRGGQDEFDFVYSHVAFRFLYREVFADQSMPTFFDPPETSSPGNPQSGGSLKGFAMPKEGTLRRLAKGSYGDDIKIELELGSTSPTDFDIKVSHLSQRESPARRQSRPKATG